MGMNKFRVWTISYEQERMTQKAESKALQVHPRIIGNISKNWDWVILKGWEQRWYWPIWHFLHVHAYVRVHVLVHMHGGQRTTSSVVAHSGHLPYFIETKVLTRIWGSPFMLGWLVLQPQASSCLCLLMGQLVWWAWELDYDPHVCMASKV